MIIATHRRIQRYGKDRGRISSTILDFMQGPDVSHLSVLEELALARTLLSDLVLLYEDATDPELDIPADKRMAAVINLQPKLRDAIDAVRSLAKTAADIENIVSIQPMMVASLAQTLQTTIVRLCGEDETLLESFEHEIASVFAMLKRPDDSPEILSPAETVRMIDSLVPKAESPEDYVSTLEVKDDFEGVTWTTLDDLEQGPEQ